MSNKLYSEEMHEHFNSNSRTRRQSKVGREAQFEQMGQELSSGMWAIFKKMKWLFIPAIAFGLCGLAGIVWLFVWAVQTLAAS